MITFCGDATKPTAPSPVSATPSHSSSAAHKIPTPVTGPPQNVEPKPPVVPPSPVSVPAPAESSTVPRKSCNNKKRQEAQKLARAEQESRALYDFHRRRRGYNSAADVHRRSF